MADPILMLSDEKVHGHIDSFVDENGNPQTVDAVEWRTSDDTVFTITVSPDGMDVDVLAIDMPVDTPAKTAELALHVKEGGVDDAFIIRTDVVISSVASPLAIGANMTFGAPTKK